ncbi:hypothetical protein LTR85_005299 [Meristemomyces frigidus]|nr:hypothetical protein LTR85_005299 [Meristemomyces frigidus]
MPAGKDVSVPVIDGRESFDTLVRKLSVHFIQHIDAPHTFEDLRKAVYTKSLQPLVTYLADEVQHPGIVCALLALKWHFAAAETGDDRGISDTRGLACELVAWRFVTHLTEQDAIDHLCYELSPSPKQNHEHERPNGAAAYDGTDEANAASERTPLLDEAALDQSFVDDDAQTSSPDDNTSFLNTFAGLNALEIAAVSDAKKFLSQRAIQRIIDGIWKGDIVFWETMSQTSKKQAKLYNKHKSDPFCRLRVPLYSKVFEAMFFAVFIGLYYSVLVQKPIHYVSASEILLYVWLTAFAYNELAEFWDAGTTLYATDFWSLWDLGIIATGVAFFIVRVVGLAKHDDKLIDTAFDILSIEALFLVPRICSLLSLHPYFGTLLPCLKEMTKDFIKFLGLVAILYIGFDTTFIFLARGTFSVGKMNWILIKVFFGSSYLGFDTAEEISPILGPPLMFMWVMDHAREEYLSVYAVYVLEASTSNRLTYFIPPLNLVPLVLRPLRLVLPAERLRAVRIFLLKATHFPFVALILGWESWRLYWSERAKSSSGLTHRGLHAPTTLRRPRAQLPLLAAGTRQMPLDKQTRTPRSPSTKPSEDPAAGSETIEALEMAVDSLRTQLETITSLIAKEKRHRTEC